MSYQALARKWRPQIFAELMGQTHVVSALSNALNNDRLHHAYLFTGTRGVGKTTIARIFSKSLNCVQGVTAEPCGECQNCVAIEEGRFVDLVEVDAASRTKVEDTREILDNVQYSPTQGRYKVYLIDEVHMLSRHSFNALLKTLEEPPPHVKFLLATTDPQKLPVTILSRCLQFTLKALTITQIEQQLNRILDAEKIPYQADAINQLAISANGSVRDALSLTDQAVAQGNGQVNADVVRSMLGMLDEQHTRDLLFAMVKGDFEQVMQAIENLSIAAVEPEQALIELLNCMHQMALIQVLPVHAKLNPKLASVLTQLAQQLSAEQIQLFYQILLKGRQDLPFAANPRSGLEMTLLRLIAFQPKQEIALNLAQQPELTVHNEEKKHHLIEKKTLDLASPEAEDDLNVDEVENQCNSQSEDKEKLLALVAEQAQIESLAQSQLKQHNVNVNVAPVENNKELSPSYFDQQSVDAETYEQAPAHLLNDKDTLTRENTDLTTDNVEQQDNELLSSDAMSAVSNMMSAIQLDRDNAVKVEDVNDQAEPDFTHRISELAAQSANYSSANADSINVEPLTSEPPPWQEDNSQSVTSSSVTPTFAAPSPLLTSDTGADICSTTPDLSNLALNEKVRTGVVKSAEVDIWAQIVDSADLIGLQRQVALHSTLDRQGDVVVLTIEKAHQHLLTEQNSAKIQLALSHLFNTQIDLQLVVTELGQATPFNIQKGINQERQSYAIELIYTDKNVIALQENFNAQVIDDSIKPI